MEGLVEVRHGLRMFCVDISCGSIVEYRPGGSREQEMPGMPNNRAI